MVTVSRPLLETTERGLYCATGDFFVDPWQPVDRAVITHAHADHACAGCGRYLTTRAGERVLRVRLGPEVLIDAVEYGEAIVQNGVEISLHPAGHILGSAQARIEHQGGRWVVSGDYKVESDPTCSAFESVRCHVFVSESTFGLPIYRWPASRGFRAYRCLVASQSGAEEGKRPLRLRARQGAAAPCRSRPEHRADRLPRGGGKDERGLSRRGNRLAGDDSCRGCRTGDRLESFFDRGSALGRRVSLATPLRAGVAGFCVGLDADPRARGGAGASIAGSYCPTTLTGPVCSG